MPLSVTYNTARQVFDLSILERGLPGIVTVSHQAHPHDDKAHIIDLCGHDEMGEVKYECRFGFNFHPDCGHATIKNFSIHDAGERGQGLGAKVVANLLDVTRARSDLSQITLTAELERGAYVWARMGWLPNETSFTKLQKTCQPKLNALQHVLPESTRLGPLVYGIFNDLLDADTTKDPHYIWAMVDTKAAYDVQALADLQRMMNNTDTVSRREDIRNRALANGRELTREEVQETDKALRFLKNLDLDGLSNQGMIPVALVLFAWEQWKGAIDMNNQEQVDRLESRLTRARAANAPEVHGTENHALNSSGPRGLHV